MRALAPIAALLLACAPQRDVAGAGHVEGRLAPVNEGAAYLFLYEPGEGPPDLPVEPLYATGISSLRLGSGDTRFVFADVEDGSYRLWGFVDTDRNVRVDPPLLAQLGRGDRPLVAQTVTVDGGVVLDAEVALGGVETADPPAFVAAGLEGEVTLPDLPLQVVQLTLVSTEIAGVGGQGFEVSLIDANGDGVADDADGDGLPDLAPQIFLRFCPRPGQSVPLDTRGRPADVVVPLRFLPAAFLATLGGDPSARITVPELTVFLIPQATAIFREPGGRRLTTTLEAIPVGDYELVMLTERGQVWQVPNALPGPSQATRFTFVHGS